jgi:hypothetical protein
MPDMQMIVVGIIVAVAAILLTRQWLRPWLRKASGCGGACGCGHSTNQANEKTQILIGETLEVRKR